jgi:signal transduction histidine kinase/DNA-binding response OmpR family regulator
MISGGAEMGALVRAFDWAKTPLGPSDQWSASLRMIVSLLLANRFPMLLWWGPQYIQIYNDAYRPILGAKHPLALGQPASACWSEVWDFAQPLIDSPFQGGPSTWMEDVEFEIYRHGFTEECHFTFGYGPVPDETAPRGIGGVLATVHETTEQVIGQRRVGILSDLGARVAEGKTADKSCAIAVETLVEHPKDVPFVLMYLLEPNNLRLRRICELGFSAGSAGPTDIALDSPEAGAPWPLARCLSTQRVEVVRGLSALLPAVPQGPWADAPDNAVVLPIRSNDAHRPAGVIVIGVSSRIALDPEYLMFIDLMTSQVATGVANARAYEAERQRAEALAEIDRAKTVFFSNVSHEFRTPLTLMLGPIEQAVANAQDPVKVRAQLTLARRSATRLLKLVNSLLDFSRIEAGRVQAFYEAVDLSALTRDLASTFRSAIERAGLRFDVECDELGERVFVDREMWEKIVLNLLSNALKFTFKGAITVRLRAQSRHAVLEVSDSGVGIPVHEIPRVFERFYRVEGRLGRTHEGSGIGLALVRELVKLHEATIEVASDPSRGTMFRILVPLGSSHLPPGRLKAPVNQVSMAIGAQAFVQEALRWLPDPSGATSSNLPELADGAARIIDQRFAATFGARIILADDNADMRAYLRELLAPIYAIEAVANGEQAFDAARRQRPDLILSDIMMPVLDGLGLLAAVRADKSLQNVPVVLLSARAGEEARIEGLDAGADDYLIKPFSARELVARLGALLELAHMRRQSEEALRRRTVQFETLLNEAPLGVYLIDADFRVREGNPTGLGAFAGISNLIGRDFSEVAHILWDKEHADKVVRLFRDTLESGDPYVAPECVDERRDRAVRQWYEWQINRIALPDGRYGVVCYSRDISAHIHARTALQATDRQKDEFLAMLAHELRNPLAALRSASELLRRPMPAAVHTQCVGVIGRQVRQLTRMIDDLLDVSRITRGAIELVLEPLELGTVVAQALETVEPLMREKRHKASIVPSDQELHVNGDRARLVQCVGNILTNATKYTDSRGDIRVRSYALGTWAVIEISDSGIGMSAELLSGIFDLFVQNERTPDRSQGGLGIGLAVVKRLVEMHGGKVSARSRGLGQGSTFEIHLPLSENFGAVLSETDSPIRTSMRVLIVDDNVDAADLLVLLLRREGHDAEAVYKSRDGLERAEVFRPDIVLLDIGLPELDGYEVARRLRSNPALSHMRLIAVTGYGQANDRARTLAAGFDDHLVKPVGVQQLQRSIGGIAAADFSRPEGGAASEA